MFSSPFKSIFKFQNTIKKKKVKTKVNFANLFVKELCQLNTNENTITLE